MRRREFISLIGGVAANWSLAVQAQTKKRPLVGWLWYGKSDIAVYRDGTWYVQQSMAGFLAFRWGIGTDIPAPADYDGDGKTDIAIWRPSTGQWYRILSRDGVDNSTWGEPTDIPVPADYDGDGKSDIAVFRPSTGEWWLRMTTAGFSVQTFGITGDVPVPSSYTSGQ